MTSILGGLGIPLMIIALGVGLMSVIMMVARNYKKCPPNMAMVLSGRKYKAKDAQGAIVERGFRLVVGGAAFRFPLLERLDWINLDTFQVEFNVKDAPNTDGVPVTVDAVANLRISSEQHILEAAVGRLLGKKPEEIEIICRNTLEGQLRQIVGTLSIEDMVRNREVISQKVLDVSKAELEKIGIGLDNFVIKGVTDPVGYVEAMGKTKTAQVKRDATIGEAEALRESTMKSSTAIREGQEKKLANDQAVAVAERELAVRRAELKVETDTAQAKAELAGAMARADIEKDLKTRQAAVDAADEQARIAVAEQRAARREQELVAEVIRPAEAKKKADVTTAEGVKQAAILAAEGEAKAIETRAAAENIRLRAEGEGQALANAALKRELGIAEADVTRATMLAQAEGTQKKGEAEGAAIQAKLLAEAMGLLKKQEALAQMTPAARTVIILEMLPQIIAQAGEAGEKIVGAAADPIGAGLSRIDKLEIVDFGGGNGNGQSPLVRLGSTVPQLLNQLILTGKAMNIDFGGLFRKIGITVSEDQLKSALEQLGITDEEATR